MFGESLIVPDRRAVEVMKLREALLALNMQREHNEAASRATGGRINAGRRSIAG